MKKMCLGILLCFGGSSFSANEVVCVCSDGSRVSPACGICGSLKGTMEPTESGADCICEGDLKMPEVSCKETCELQGSRWTGTIESSS